MKRAPLCVMCGSLMIERRLFTTDGTVIVSHHCDCGHLDSFSLNFSQSPAIANRSPGAARVDEECSGAMRFKA
jgi:hypothetical protein